MSNGHGDSITYAKYKDARDAAWQTLINSNVRSLPVSVSQIIKKMGIAVKQYTAGDFPDIIVHCGLESVAAENCAFTIYTDSYHVFCNADAPSDYLRFYAAHEMGHILLGHPMERVKVGYFTAYYTGWNKREQLPSQQEIDANLFASRLLAPACVLAEISAVSKDDIMNLCGLPPEEASARAKRMQTLIERNAFLTSGLEKRVREQFGEFIASHKKS